MQGGGLAEELTFIQRFIGEEGRLVPDLKENMILQDKFIFVFIYLEQRNGPA